MRVEVYSWVDGSLEDELIDANVETPDELEDILIEAFSNLFDTIIYIYPSAVDFYSTDGHGEARIDYFYEDAEIDYRNSNGSLFIYKAPQGVDEAISDITLDFLYDFK